MAGVKRRLHANSRFLRETQQSSQDGAGYALLLRLVHGVYKPRTPSPLFRGAFIEGFRWRVQICDTRLGKKRKQMGTGRRR